MTPLREFAFGGQGRTALIGMAVGKAPPLASTGAIVLSAIAFWLPV